MVSIASAVGSLQVTEDDVIGHSIDIFSPHGREASMLYGDTVAYRPTNAINDVGPYYFNISPQGNRGLLLNTARLELTVKIQSETAAAGGDHSLTDAADVGPINNFVGSFVNKIDIQLDGSEIAGLTNTDYAYKQYIETILSYGPEAGSGHLVAGGFYMDEAYQFEKVDRMNAAKDNKGQVNNGFAMRRHIAAKSQNFKTIAPIHSDIFQTDKMFPPGFDFTIVISRNSDDFCLMRKGSATKYKIKVLDMKIFIKHLALTENATSNYLGMLGAETVRIPFNKTELRQWIVSDGQSDFFMHNAIQGTIPKNVLVFFAGADSTSNQETNPYNFQHLNVSEAYIRVNGNQIPSDPYKPEWVSYTGANREYRALCDNVGIMHGRNVNSVTLDLFKGGAFFLAFDLSPDQCNGYHNHMKKTGQIDLFLRFKTALAKSARVFMFINYEAELKISPSREVLVTY